MKAAYLAAAAVVTDRWCWKAPGLGVNRLPGLARPRGSSLRHQQEIRRMLLGFAAAVDAERSLDQVAREDCTTFLRVVQERGGKPNTLKADHCVLDAFFIWPLQEERLTISPMKRAPKPMSRRS